MLAHYVTEAAAEALLKAALVEELDRKHSACERSVLIMAGGIAACDWCC